MLCGCGESSSTSDSVDDGEKKEKVTTSASGETTTTDGDTTATTATTQEWDGAAYNGEWATRDFDWEYSGQHLLLNVNSAAMRITYTEVFSATLVSAEMTLPVSKMDGNTIEGEFNDSFGNTGVLKLTFEEDKIVCEISDVEESGMNLGYSPNEGEYILRPYEEPEKEKITLYLIIGPFGDPVYCTDPDDLDTAFSDPSAYSDYDVEVIDLTDEYDYSESGSEEGESITVPAGLFGTYYDSWGNYTELNIETAGINDDLVVLYVYLVAGDYELYITESEDNNTAFYAEGTSLWDGSECSAELQYDPNDGYVVMTLSVPSLGYEEQITFIPAEQW